MFGQDLNPNLYKRFRASWPHLGAAATGRVAAARAFTTTRGGHARVGCMVSGRQLARRICATSSWQHSRSRISRDFGTQGSTYVAKHGPDFMMANDPWFRGLGLKYGPDGSLRHRWTDTGECHNYDKVDARQREDLPSPTATRSRSREIEQTQRFGTGETAHAQE